MRLVRTAALLRHSRERDGRLRCRTVRAERPRMFLRSKSTLPTSDEALKGRPQRWFELAERHKALDAPLVTDEVPEGYGVAVFGLGCFWGAEEKSFWRLPGRLVDVGRVRRRRRPRTRRTRRSAAAAPGTPRPCAWSSTPAKVWSADLRRQAFWESARPDAGDAAGRTAPAAQYRSAIYYSSPASRPSMAAAAASRDDVPARAMTKARVRRRSPPRSSPPARRRTTSRRSTTTTRDTAGVPLRASSP